MLDVGPILLVEELDWICSIVIKRKKTSGIFMCVKLCGFNEAYIHEPFPTPFSVEILEKDSKQ